MGLRPAWALLWVLLLGGGALACLLPLTAALPTLFSPAIYGRFVPQHAYRAPGITLLAPVALGIILFTLCAALYFWLTALPQTLRYRPKRRRGNG